MTTAPPKEVFDFLKKTHDEFQPLSEKIVFDKTNPLHRNSISLYGSIIELTGSVILLLNSKLGTGVPILLRAILEAYVDLFNLINNAQYGYNLEVSYLKEWLKILEEASHGKNEYLQFIADEPTLPETIDSWRKKKKSLEKKGYRSLRIEQKFKQAGMQKEYKSLYNMLCSDAHNNLRSLVDRHIEREETDFSIIFYKEYTADDTAHHVGSNLEILVRATQLIHDFFDSPVKGDIVEYRNLLDGLRGER